MSWISGSKPSIMTQTIEDPIKTRVSNPLSNYLASEIGKGLPMYTGQLNEPLDPKAYSSYQNFLAINPDEWWKGAIETPTLQAVQKAIPQISEGFAGGLRSSGHYAALGDYGADVTRQLATSRYQAGLEIPQAQFNMAQSYQKQKEVQFAKEYGNWWSSLPQNNPALSQAIQFLAGPTGRDVLTYQTPGTAGKGMAMGALLGMIAAGALAIPTGGLTLAAMPAFAAAVGIGGAVGGTAGSLLNE